MLLIAAAMEEELQVAMSLCRNRTRLRGRAAGLRQATRSGHTICFLKTGVGPRRSAARLEQALQAAPISRILVIGYGGALAPNLKLGNLVAVGRALACSLNESQGVLEHARVENIFELANGEELVETAKSAGMEACLGDALTSSCILGEPEHKRLLFDKFQALIVDMETAALARVAGSRAVPISCIRFVSDEAQDTFLAPFSYDPSANIPVRAAGILRRGNLVKTYRKWRKNASVARASLGRFLSHYL